MNNAISQTKIPPLDTAHECVNATQIHIFLLFYADQVMENIIILKHSNTA